MGPMIRSIRYFRANARTSSNSARLCVTNAGGFGSSATLPLSCQNSYANSSALVTGSVSPPAFSISASVVY